MNVFTQESQFIACKTLPPIFDHLSTPEIDLIHNNQFEVNYKPKEVIFKQGTSLTHVCCLSTGFLKAYIEVSPHKNLLLALINPPFVIGGPGLFTDYKHHFTVTAIEEVTACFIDINAIEEVILKNGRFALELMKLANIEGLYNLERLVSLTQKQMQGRIADAIIFLADIIYKSNPFQLSISRQDLADLTALSKESVIRILKDFTLQGIVVINGRSFEIKNRESLDNISKTI